MIFIATIISVPVGFILGAILASLVGYNILGVFFLISSWVGIPAYTFYFYKNKRYTKDCIYCAEKIKKEAIYCRHCEKEQVANNNMVTSTVRTNEIKSFDDKLKYLFVVIILLVVLLFVIANIIDLAS